MLLKGKIALVTGSTHNIGLAIARAFARERATVVVHSRHEEDASESLRRSMGIFLSRTWPSPTKSMPCLITSRKPTGASIFL